MMEEKKYYVPTIKEFHVEFEYEVFVDKNFEYWGHTKGTWKEEEFYGGGVDMDGGNSEIEAIRYCLDDNKSDVMIRVKYLDKEDIESLGWKSSDRLIREFYIKDKNVVYYLNSIPNGKIHIKQEWNPYKEVVNTEDLFIGYLKNKSELQRLMKQLGI